MADFNEAFSHILDSFRVGSGNNFHLPALPAPSSRQRSRECWHGLRNLGFSHCEIISHIKNLYCQEVWWSIYADKIQHQALAEAMFSFSLLTDSRQAIFLLQTVSNYDATGEMSENFIHCVNRQDNQDLLMRFSIAKIVHYGLTLNQQEMPFSIQVE
ncbi:MAG: hypothetical protein RPT25_16070 [Cycloclasticus sp.]|jgi:hypothetical protein